MDDLVELQLNRLQFDQNDKEFAIALEEAKAIVQLEEQLRQHHPSVKDAWEQYQIVLKLAANGSL